MTEHTERPWGGYTVLAEAGDFKVKTIEVHPGQRLSYQRHSRRAEHWFVVRGEGVVTLDGRDIDVRRGDTVDVALGAAHRIRNTGTGPLVFVEVEPGWQEGSPQAKSGGGPARSGKHPWRTVVRVTAKELIVLDGGRNYQRARLVAPTSGDGDLGTCAGERAIFFMGSMRDRMTCRHH